jgi:hypothetical protein
LEFRVVISFPCAILKCVRSDRSSVVISGSVSQQAARGACTLLANRRKNHGPIRGQPESA